MANRNYSMILPYTRVTATVKYGYTQDYGGHAGFPRTSYTPGTGRIEISLNDIYELCGQSAIINTITLSWESRVGGNDFPYTCSVDGQAYNPTLKEFTREFTLQDFEDGKISLPIRVEMLIDQTPSAPGGEWIQQHATILSNGTILTGAVSTKYLILSKVRAKINYEGDPIPSYNASANIVINSEPHTINKIWIGDNANVPHLAKKIWIGTPEGNKLIFPPKILGNQDIGALLYLKENQDSDVYTPWRIVARNHYSTNQEGTETSYTTVLMRETLLNTYSKYDSRTGVTYFYRSQTLDKVLSNLYDEMEFTNGILLESIQPVYILSYRNNNSFYAELEEQDERILRYVFAPSQTEIMGGADTLVALEGPQFEWFIGKDKSYYVKSLPNGTKTEYWTRTPVGGTAAGVTISTSGGTANRTSNNYICPCICLPNTLAVGDYADGLKLLIQG